MKLTADEERFVATLERRAIQYQGESLRGMKV